MAKAQNTFIKSKMNKDLDDRLLSKGEYRDAQNVSVSKSEGDDVGALENILGNSLTSTLYDAELATTVIGSLSDESNNRMFFVITNYTDTSIDNLSNPAPAGAACALVMYDQNSDSTQVLLQGNYLNFSTTHPVHGINLIEDLLFWTDNRNQPRKINVNSAISSPASGVAPYYTNEDQISLAKYYPCDTPKLITTKNIAFASSIEQGSAITGLYGLVTVTLGTGETLPEVGDYIKLGTTNQTRNIRVIKIASASTFHIESIDNTGSPNMLAWSSQSITVLSSTMKNKNTEFLSISNYGEVNSQPTSTGNVMWCISKPEVGDQAVNDVLPLNTVVSAVTQFGSSDGPVYNVVLNPAAPSTLGAQPKMIVGFCKPNPDYQANWPGDSDYLEDKFVRFAYRFKFDDGEYSIISPYTQPAFVPKQQGYVGVGKTNPNTGVTYLKTQEQELGTSTIVSFFENQINEVKVHIKMPHIVNTLFDKLKIIEIDILYKESDALAVKVLDTFSTSDSIITSNSTNTFIYNYQSKKPWKVLTEADTIRIYDKIPVRAKTQSVTGNRVVFGNFIDKHTSPETLDYAVNASSKFFSFSDDSNGCNVSYPKHSLKQNRTYQVGLVLQDKYGRSSDVVISSIKDSVITYQNLDYGGSTLFHKYRTNIMPVPNNFEWQGDSLKILWSNIIPETIANATGYPGIYRSGFVNATASNDAANIFTLTEWSNDIIVGSIVQGNNSSSVSFSEAITAIDVDNKKITLSNNVTISGGTAITIIGNANPLGWYSYKVVVKQQAQEYYNAYTPPPLLNSPTGSVTNNPTGQGSMITLLSDNINKIAADLTEVTPEQTLFRTSDEILFPRVATTASSVDVGTGTDSSKVMPKQTFLNYSNEGIFFTVGNLGKVTDLGINTNDPITDAAITAPGIFSAISDPTVATLRTDGFSFGALFNAELPGFGVQTTSSLAGLSGILEIKPPDSNLEIFWETSTSGLVSELNTAILNDNAALTPGSLQTTQSYSLAEGNSSVGSNFAVYKFKVLNANGDPMQFVTGDSMSMVTTNGAGTTLSNWGIDAGLNSGSPSAGSIATINVISPGLYYYYQQNSNLNTFNHVITVNKVDGASTTTGTFTVTGNLSNVAPTIYNAAGTAITSYSQTISSGTVDIVFNARNGSQFSFFGSANFGGFGGKELQWQNPGGTNASNFSWLGGTSGTEIGVNTNNPALQKLNRNTLRFTTTTSGTYTCKISVKDANGTGISHPSLIVTVTVNLPLEEGPPAGQ